MAAGKHGSSEITISYDDGPGGSLRVLTPYVQNFGGVKLTSVMQKSTAFGDSIEKMLPTGMSIIAQIPISGLWDDTALVGPHIVFIAPDTSPQASTRSMVVVYGNSRTWSSEGYLVSYEVLGKNGNLTEYAAVTQHNSGAWS
jgi:hypothetical protein